MILETPTLLVVQGSEWAVDYYLTGPVQPDGKEPGITAYSDNPSSSFFTYATTEFLQSTWLFSQCCDKH